jgi:hypothetical protein
MFKASTVEQASHVLVTIDGELSNEYVESVNHCCEQALRSGKPVHLLLRDVSVIDEAGRRFLTQAAARGVYLRANGIYNRYVIRACASGVSARKCQGQRGRAAGSPA